MDMSAILKSLCKEFLSYNVSAILYLINYEQYGRSTASAQYFLQLAGYLGIPVIAWNADNSGLERKAARSSLQLQLAPSLEHQTAAMLSILERYKWHQFSVVVSLIAGHDDFIQAVRERVSAMQTKKGPLYNWESEKELQSEIKELKADGMSNKRMYFDFLDVVAEVTERQKRKNNIIVFNIEEPDQGKSPDDRATCDKAAVKEILRYQEQWTFSI
ncbi:unnamed protein product [Acanthoscelides obtectus]|uniref:Receptor ligand binding region domain-containing protein n=1 Tax=Acanthoscelides obtectus TaxID=200917 RepID=A0A9P0KRX1_ACAOB|nr:unnamed protein product [Acanthoscelides obtectus]CAK1653700.1 Glutamate receptor ionotropic, NMDA 2B [Acanthoscelides obtectus]